MTTENNFDEASEFNNLGALQRSLAASGCSAFEFTCINVDCEKDFVVLCDNDFVPKNCPFCAAPGIVG